jgi:hypothetical protein
MSHTDNNNMTTGQFSRNSSHGDEDIVVDADADNVEDNEEPMGTRRQVGGAAVAGGIAGLLLAGPVIGLVAAGGAAAIATGRGKAGQVARSTGEVVSDAGVRLKKFDEKHHVVEKTSNGIIKGCTWVSKKLQQPEKRTQRQRTV